MAGIGSLQAAYLFTNQNRGFFQERMDIDSLEFSLGYEKRQNSCCKYVVLFDKLSIPAIY